MLSTAERVVSDNGLGWAFCDTDSIAIAKPHGMERAEFSDRVRRSVEWFADLNPYAFGGSILKVEDYNFSLDGSKTPVPLFCWAVSAKRYALFNIAPRRQPVLRKGSAHGLGHMRPPYTDKNPAPATPKPAAKLKDLKVELWQHDLWWHIVSAALRGKPNQVDLSYHSALEQPAVSRYAATSPKLLRWFSAFNANRSYERQVKPFGFLLSLFARDTPTEVVLDGDTQVNSRPRQPKPVAPFDKDLARALENARCRRV